MKAPPLDAMGERVRLDQVARVVIECAGTVSNILGHGFIERVYENALCLEFDRRGVEYKRQHGINVWYRESPVGEFVADLFVEDCLLVELKVRF